MVDTSGWLCDPQALCSRGDFPLDPGNVIRTRSGLTWAPHGAGEESIENS